MFSRIIYTWLPTLESREEEDNNITETEEKSQGKETEEHLRVLETPRKEEGTLMTETKSADTIRLQHLQPYVLLTRLEDMVPEHSDISDNDMSDNSVDIKNDFFPSDGGSDDCDYVPSISTVSSEISDEISDVDDISQAEVKDIQKVAEIDRDLLRIDDAIIKKKKRQLEELEILKKQMESKLETFEPTSKSGNICFICNEIHDRTRRHLPKFHKDHPQVQQWMDEKDQITKEALMKLMIYEGNHEHNLAVRNTGIGLLKPIHSSEKITEPDLWGPCKQCLGRVRTRLLYEHRPSCPKRVIKRRKKELKTVNDSEDNESSEEGLFAPFI